MIDILIATFNGGKYLSEQLDSLLLQSYKNFRIVIRDDGSSDNTNKIIEYYYNQYPEKIKVIKDNIKCGSSASNFIQLVKNATAEYVMFCDQDDYWLANKVEVTLEKMLNAEKQIGSDKPILVYSNLQNVDENLNKLDDVKTVNNEKMSLNQLIVDNIVAGCTSMVNKRLYSMIGDFDNRILMHDWWVALIAVSMGTIIHIPNVLMYYRQHNNNVVGFIDLNCFAYIKNNLFNAENKNKLYAYAEQVNLLLERYENQIPIENRIILKKYTFIYREKQKLFRILKLIKGNFLKRRLIRKLGQLYYI